MKSIKEFENAWNNPYRLLRRRIHTKEKNTVLADEYVYRSENKTIDFYTVLRDGTLAKCVSTLKLSEIVEIE